MSRAIDMTGKVFGLLFVVGEAYVNKGRHKHWECICECGNTVIASVCNLQRNHCLSCGCKNKLTVDNIEGELWVDIIGFEGIFQISNMGRVKALPKEWVSGKGAIRRQGEILRKLSRNTKKYWTVLLRKDRKHYSFLVSRLVALHFIPNPENKPQVNHLFGDINDNRAISLEWSTGLENVHHAWAIGLNRVLSGGEIGTSKVVLDLSTGIFYDCAKEAWRFATKFKRYQTLVDKLNGAKDNNTSLIYA